MKTVFYCNRSTKEQGIFTGWQDCYGRKMSRKKVDDAVNSIMEVEDVVVPVKARSNTCPYCEEATGWRWKMFNGDADQSPVPICSQPECMGQQSFEDKKYSEQSVSLTRPRTVTVNAFIYFSIWGDREYCSLSRWRFLYIIYIYIYIYIM